MKPDANPMRSAHAAPRCSARSKRSGAPCRGPAVQGWTVCRMNGAGGGAPEGPGNGAWTGGERSKDAVETRRALAALLASAHRLMDEL